MNSPWPGKTAVWSGSVYKFFIESTISNKLLWEDDFPGPPGKSVSPENKCGSEPGDSPGSK